MLGDIARIICNFEQVHQRGVDLFRMALSLADTIALPQARHALRSEVLRNQAEAGVLPQDETISLPNAASRTQSALALAHEHRYDDARVVARSVNNQSFRGEILREIGLLAVADGATDIVTDIVSELRLTSPKDAPRIVEAAIDTHLPLSLQDIANMCYGDIGLSMLAMGAIVDRHPELAEDAAALVSLV